MRSAEEKTELIINVLNIENVHDCVTLAQPQSHCLAGDWKPVKIVLDVTNKKPTE